MSEAAFIAGDWGTSRLRLYLCDTRGVVLARGEGEGASVPDCAGRFAAAVAPWDKAHGVLPAVLGVLVIHRCVRAEARVGVVAPALV